VNILGCTLSYRPETLIDMLAVKNWQGV